jgi:hypothetical protein
LAGERVDLVFDGRVMGGQCNPIYRRRGRTVNCLDLAAARTVPAATPTGPGAIVGAWLTAGRHTGIWLGAAFGAVVTVFGGFAPLVFIGAVVGAVVGGIAGIAIGSAKGVVLALLAATSLFGSSARHATRTATAAAVITTAIGGLTVQLTLLGNPPNIVVYAPATMGVLAAAALSRRLPPGQTPPRQRHQE